MLVYVALRTRDAEMFIEEFCDSYSWADKIIIADGGSKDNTKRWASNYYNVEIRDFTEQVWNNGISRNPHGKHINFLIDWAEEEGADWIIFDDVDCYPNYAINEEWENVFSDANKSGAEFILANRAYIYGDSEYFQELTCPKVLRGSYDSPFIPSLWAWKTGLGFRASEDDPLSHEFNKVPTEHPRKELYPPYGLLHYFYPSDEYMKEKIEFYNKIYERGAKDPKEYGGKLLPLEDWMWS